MFCGLVIIIKILIPSTAGGLCCPFRFHIFFSMAFLKFFVAAFLPKGCFGWYSFLFYFYFLVFLLKFYFVTTLYDVLANAAEDYFRLISRNGNTALIHVLNYCAYLPLNLFEYVKFCSKQVAMIQHSLNLTFTWVSH